jgi:hypothetical protein
LQFQEGHGWHDQRKCGVANENYDRSQRMTGAEQGRKTKPEKQCPG